MQLLVERASRADNERKAKAKQGHAGYENGPEASPLKPRLINATSKSRQTVADSLHPTRIDITHTNIMQIMFRPSIRHESCRQTLERELACLLTLVPSLLAELLARELHGSVRSCTPIETLVASEARYAKLNMNYEGMVEQVVAGASHFFAGAFFSTFTNFIVRQRAYRGRHATSRYLHPSRAREFEVR